jgi:2-methylcitrate dehydratase PrpD
MFLAERLASFAKDLRFADIPSDLVTDISLHALDTIGVCLASTPLPYARAVAEFVRHEAGGGRSTAFGLPGRYPARNAGFYNASLGHGMDFDDSHLVAIAHPSATILPPLLALAEENGCAGEALVTALVAGVEVMTRVGVVCGAALLGRGLHPTSACGSFGAVAAIAKFNNMTQAQTVAALGMVGAMTGGLHQSTIDGTWNKCIHSGLAVQAGFEATALAKAGFSGPPSILDGEAGFIAAFAGLRADAAARAVCDGLGERWEAGRLAYKLYPCCQGLHPYADCAIDLAREENIDLKLVERIDVRVGKLVGITLCEPPALKYRPPTPYAAKFSMPYVVASALTHGEVTSDSFTAQAIADPQVLQLADKVHYAFDPIYDEGTALRGWLQLQGKDGRTFLRSTLASRGTPENPWAQADIIGKFLRNATPIIGADRARALVELTPALACSADAGEFARLCQMKTA